MKKTYKTPEVRLVGLGEELLGGLTQESVQGDALFPDGTEVAPGGPSSGSDDPEAKRNRGFWDDED